MYSDYSYLIEHWGAQGRGCSCVGLYWTICKPLALHTGTARCHRRSPECTLKHGEICDLVITKFVHFHLCWYMRHYFRWFMACTPQWLADIPSRAPWGLVTDTSIPDFWVHSDEMLPCVSRTWFNQRRGNKVDPLTLIVKFADCVPRLSGPWGTYAHSWSVELFEWRVSGTHTPKNWDWILELAFSIFPFCDRTSVCTHTLNHKYKASRTCCQFCSP